MTAFKRLKHVKGLLDSLLRKYFWSAQLRWTSTSVGGIFAQLVPLTCEMEERRSYVETVTGMVTVGLQSKEVETDIKNLVWEWRSCFCLMCEVWLRVEWCLWQERWWRAMLLRFSGQTSWWSSQRVWAGELQGWELYRSSLKCKLIGLWWRRCVGPFQKFKLCRTQESSSWIGGIVA